MKTLVLGGARSGKSRYAETIAGQNSKEIIYLATATPGDEEMKLRIDAHQHQRPDSWILIEEPLYLADVISTINGEKCLLVDCLTLWLTNCLADEKVDIEHRISELVDTVTKANSDIILVSNEVGQGIVPMGELSRKFVDESGRLHQKLAQVCDRVVFVVAGLPQILK